MAVKNAGGSSLDKRQASLIVLGCAEGPQPRIGIIFRGPTYPSTPQGIKTRMLELESLEYNCIEQNGVLTKVRNNVAVYFQPAAWMDTLVMREFLHGQLAPFLLQQKIERSLLLMDNLEAHIAAPTKDTLQLMNTEAAFSPPNLTHSTQAVDDGIGRQYQTRMGSK